MLFRRLVIDGVGPFGSHYEIDLDSLTASGLFLLEGPTGSGKSSLIDAIVFALYGRTAGDESDYSRIRSTHADPAKPSTVELVFTVSGGTYYVRRSPRWDKPKRDGGTTTVSEKATLIRLSETAIEQAQWDKGEPLASGARDVGTELSKILPLTRAQFVQTVVLPQGQFADFLRLKSEDRSTLLETLFNTGVYRQFATALHQRAVTASKKIDKRRQAVTEATASWLGNPAVAEWDEKVRQLLDELVDPEQHQLIETLSDVSDTLDERQTHSATELQRLTKLADEARAKLSAEQALAGALEKRASLLTQQQDLFEQTEQIEAGRELVKRHFASVVPLERQRTVVDTDKELAKRRKSLDTTLSRIDEGIAVYESSQSPSLDTLLVEQTVDALETKVEEVDERVTDLQQLHTLEKGNVAREKEINKLGKQLARYQTELEETHARREELPQKINQTQHDLDQAQLLANTLPEVQRKLDDVNEKAQILTQAQAASAQLSQAEGTHKELVAAFASQNATYSEINARWVASQAAILSAELASDSPCPVCGSLEHPAPAQPQEEHVTKADVERAHEELEAVRSKLERSSASLATTRSTYEHLQEQLGEDTEETLAAQRTSLEEQQSQARSAQGQVEKLDALLAELRGEHENISVALSRLETEHHNLTATVKKEQEQLDKDSATVAKERGEATSISELIEEHKQDRKDLTATLHALSAYEQAHENLGTARQHLADALSEAAMSEEEAQEAFLGKDELAQQQAAISRFEANWAHVHGQLQEPEIAKLTGEETTAVEQRSEEYAAVQERQEECAQQAAIIRESARTAHRLYTAVDAAFRAWEKEVEDSGPLARLDQLAQAGKASHTSVSLPVWVLMKRFEMVIEHANDYLARFSHGRYELVRPDEAEKERKTGLGLSIIDYDARGEGASEIRSTRSLSGGETFYTSLSLALGLTEVVQEENGGIRIDTLMIDEGFGTLSGEVLDEVMTTLTELARDGRKVGLISHVDELKSRISNQVRITQKKGAGSTITVIS
ncbi:SMC family ATPase [Arcanobacterium phocisimile]|uniref:Nuclease SbcCD subunit C n=1 Tax=Arcanobacterium phocisimile TaxID=1302235 RepID=A0ABX7II20_9ACTO|nr:SMC family ATPase [Arcanobacterium phocisimile]QRV02472.1 SMC family ATPase [Arcanobacterium phocisimile]